MAKEEQVVVFKLGKEFYAINIFKVKEIMKLTKIVNIPSAPKYVEGIINLRDKVVPVFDL